MRLQVIAATCLLLLLSYGAEGKAISKRHVGQEWVIIPDKVACFILSKVKKVSPETAKALLDFFKKPLLRETRDLLVAKKSELSQETDELYQKITDFVTETK